MAQTVTAQNQFVFPPLDGSSIYSTVRAVLGIPQNLSQNPGDGATIISWDAVTGAQRYEYRVGGGSNPWVPVSSGTSQQIFGTNGVQLSTEIRAKSGPYTSSASMPILSTPNIGGGGSSEGFTEDFETVVTLGTPADGWYDGGPGNHQLGPNPNGGNAYVHPYQIGDNEQKIGGVNAASTQTLRRKLSAPSDVVDITFKGWSDSGFIPNDGDHLMYVRLNTSGDYEAPTVGFSAYLEATSGGKMHFNNRRTNDTFENEITATLGNDFHTGIPRNIRWYMEMNDLGSSNGILRVWVDGLLVIEDLARTYRQNSGEQFQQVILAPYAASVQTANAGVYIDDFTIATEAYTPSNEFVLDHSVFSGVEYPNGRVDFVSCRSELTDLGTHSFLLGRFFGTRGSVSVRVRSYGDSHSNVDVTLTWLNGEADYKRVDVPVASKTPGDHRIWLEVSDPTGGVVLHNDIYTIAYGIIDDGTIAPDSEAVFFNQLEASNFTGGSPTPFTGTGTQNDPFNSYYEARDYANANKGTIRYIYGEGIIVPDGVDTDLPFSSGVSLHMPETRTKTTRLVVRNKPGSTLIVDGKSGASGNKFGFISADTDESYLTFRGLIVRNLQLVSSGPCGAFWWHYGTCTENTVERCIINNIDGSVGANNSGISMWGVVSGKIWDNRISNIQTGGDSTNGNTAAFYSYLGNHLQAQYNSFASTMAGGIFHKKTIAGNVSCSSKFNDFDNTKCTYAISGGGDPGHDKILNIHNLYRGPKAQFWHSSDIAVVPTAENVIANNFFDTIGISDASAIHNYHMQGAIVYNNIFRNCRYAVDWPNAVDSDELKYFDYNQHFGTVVAYVAIQSGGVSKASYQSLHGAAATHPIGANDVTTDPLPLNIAGGSAKVQLASDSLTGGIGGGIIGVYTNIAEVGEHAPNSGLSLAESIVRTHTPFNGVNYDEGRIAIINDYSQLTSIGEHVFLIGREYGTQGAVSITYTSGGDPHENVTGVLNWPDGDATFYAVKVNVPTKGDGEHRIYLELSNPTGGVAIHHPGYPVAYGIIDDGSTWHSDSISRFFNTALGVSGTGTEADPYNNIYECIADANANSDIKFIYGEGSIIPDGTNTGNPYGTGGIFSIHAPATRADEEHRITIRHKPGSTLQVTGGGGTNIFGFYNNGSSSFCTYKGISFINLDATGVGTVPGSGIWYHYGTYKGITVEDCIFDNINGSENNGGANLYGTLGAKVYKSYFNEIQKDGDNTNGNTGGVYSYKGENISVQNCEFESTMSKGIYLKGTELGEVSICARFNVFRNCYLDFGQQGGGDPGHFGLNVSFNVFNGFRAYVYHRALDLQVGFGQNIIYNNYFYESADGVRGGIEMAFLEDVRIFNNIFHDCKFIFSDQSGEATDIPQFLDNNVVFNLTNGYSAINFVTRDKAATNTLLGTSYGANDSGVDPNPINVVGGNFKPTTPIRAGVGGDRVGPYLRDDFIIGLAA